MWPCASFFAQVAYGLNYLQVSVITISRLCSHESMLPLEEIWNGRLEDKPLWACTEFLSLLHWLQLNGGNYIDHQNKKIEKLGYLFPIPLISLPWFWLWSNLSMSTASALCLLHGFSSQWFITSCYLFQLRLVMASSYDSSLDPQPSLFSS